MPRAGDLARHAGAFVVACLGTLGVFALSLGMNAQVERKQHDVATIVDTMVAAAPPPESRAAKKQRSSPAKRARKAAAPSPSPLLSASLGGLDFGLDGGADAAIAGATAALMEDMGGAVMSEDAVEDAPTATTRTPPSYPSRARTQGQTGWVTLAFVVDVDGSVQDVHVLEADPPGVFDEAAIDAVGAWRFEPGRHEGAPVAVRVRQTVRFELE
ncbi:MAG: energy transducer TonB [Myxococcota bacterium]